MTTPGKDSTINDEIFKQEGSSQQPPPHLHRKNKSKSMHEGVQVWDDCCSCEAEPYWLEGMKEMKGKASGGKTEDS